MISYSIMSSIDHNKLSILEKEFSLYKGGLKLSGFVWILQNIVVSNNSDRWQVISALVRLFHDIDINGDGKLEWSEFNQFIVDQVLAENEIPVVFEIGMRALL